MVRIQKTHLQETFATLRLPEIVGPSAGPANGANFGDTSENLRVIRNKNRIYCEKGKGFPSGTGVPYIPYHRSIEIIRQGDMQF
jgi:hypothetical protein